MQGIADKVRHYRKTFRPPVFYALDSCALWLSVTLALLIMSAFLLDLYARLAHDVELLRPPDQLLLIVFEVPMIFGLLQVYFLGAERRFRRLHPTLKRINFRTPHASLSGEKRAYLKSTFESEDDLQALAKRLIEEWEWRREVSRRAQDTLWTRALGFYKLPSGSNFAAYMTGLLAVLAGIVITTITPETLLGSINSVLQDMWSLIRTLWIVVVFPLAVCVLPGALILSCVRDIGEVIVERLNDQYLSQKGFYKFISQVLELHDREEPLLLRKTRAQVYWSIRLSMAPLHEVPRVMKRIGKARALAKRFRDKGVFSQA